LAGLQGGFALAQGSSSVYNNPRSLISEEAIVELLESRGRQIGYATGHGGIVEGQRTLVFIHGSGGSHLHWNYQRQFFQEICNVVVVDLPGHGEAGKIGETLVETYAAHLFNLVQSIPGNGFCLFGHSLGGAIVQAFALLHPGTLDAVVLVGTGARLRVLPTILNGIQERFEETVSLINDFAFSRKSPADLIQRGVQAMGKTDPTVLLGDLTACDRFDLMDEVGDIHVPTLIVCGKDDQLTPPKYAQYLKDRIRNAKLEIIDGAGHMVMIEQPDEFNQRVLRFLQSLGAKNASQEKK
jgi:pimeloyl-ACP methyl ester carboxylesterase